MVKKERLGGDPFKVIIGTPIFRPGKGKLFDYPYLSDYSIDIKCFFNYRPLIILLFRYSLG